MNKQKRVLVTDFQQSKFNSYALNEKNSYYFSKLMTEYGLNKFSDKGACFGFTNNYLINATKNEGENYINHLNELYSIIHDINEPGNTIEKAKYDSRKMHAEIKLNKLMGDVIHSQFTRGDSLKYYDYLSGFIYEEPSNNESFEKYINKIITDNFNRHQSNYGFLSKDFVFYEKFYELQKIKTKKYMQALLINKNLSEKPGIESIESDPLFIKLKNNFINRDSIFEYKFKYEDAMFFINIISDDIYRDNYLKFKSLNKLKGINPVSDHFREKFDFFPIKNVTLKRFMSDLFLDIKSNRKSVFYNITTKNHSMGISVNVGPESGDYSYSFFDSNKGFYRLKNESEFSDFINHYIIKHDKNYDVKKNKNNEYVIGFLKYDINDFSKYKTSNVLNEQDINITTNTLLAERKVIVYLDEKKKNKLTFTDFNPETHIVKIKVSIGKDFFYLYSDILDSIDLKTKIDMNLTGLSEIKGDIFIAQHDYKVYSVDKKFDILTFKGLNQLSEDKPNINKDYKSVNLHLKPLIDNEDKIITGIAKKHQKLITDVANEYNIIIGIRPVDYKSTKLIESGEYSSKGLSIKGKSADWGPHCGFIPIDQQFSKSSGREEPEKYNAYIQQSIKEKHAIAVTLEITPERVNELIHYKTISPLKKKITEKYSKTTSIIDGKEQTFFLKKVNQEEGNSYIWQVHYLDGANIKPFQVIGDPKTKKAMTADYDLFSIIYPIAELDKYVKVTEMPTWAEWKASVNLIDLSLAELILYNDEAEYSKKEGEDNGIINERIKKIKHKINQKLERPEGFELIHHGADDVNPVSVMKDNFPVTFFLPEHLKVKGGLSGTSQSIDTYFSMNENGAIIIKDAEQLSNFQQLLINQEYRAPLNKKWSEGDGAKYFAPKRKISGNFIEIKQDVERKKSITPSESNVLKSIEPLINGEISDAKNNQIEKIFGKPVAKLDRGYDDISCQHADSHHPVMLAGERSTISDPLENWGNPILDYQDINRNRANTEQTKNISNYDYNVIIQLQGDSKVTESTANAFAKNPYNSMIIQYNLKTQKYKILHGDIAKTKTGKVRWITVGHGRYNGYNDATIYAGSDVQGYVDSLKHLKEVILNSENPDKLVLLGCHLARGSIKENFALQAVNGLEKHNMKMPIVAYNRIVGNDKYGHKHVVPYPTSRQYFESTKNYKFIYQINPDTQKLMVNGDPAALYFISQIRSGELSIDDLAGRVISDPLAIFKNNAFELDINMIKLITNHSKFYNLFIEQIKDYDLNQSSLFYDKLTQILKENSTSYVPVFKKIDIEKIQQHALTHPSEESSSVSVIIRLVGDANSTALAEQLASENPKNILIFQMDIDSRRTGLEYGNPAQLYLLSNYEPKKWVLLADSKIITHSSDALAVGLRKLKEKYLLSSPENIIFNSADISSTINIEKYETQLNSALNKQGFSDFELNFKTITFEDIVYPNSNMHLNNNFVVLDRGKNMQVKLLLEQISLKNIIVEDINLVEHPYLNGYFTNTDGSINSEKLNIAVYDPLISPEINKYLSRDAPENSVFWDSLFDIIPADNLQKQASDIQKILFALFNDPSTIYHLSENSIEKLKILFPAINKFDHGKVLALINDPNAYFLMNSYLVKLENLSDNNIIGNMSLLKGKSFLEAYQQVKMSTISRHQQFNQLQNQISQQQEGGSTNLIYHGVLRTPGASLHTDNQLGLIFAWATHLNGSGFANEFFEQKTELERLQRTGLLTVQDEKTLKQINNYINIINDKYVDAGIKIADQSIFTYLSNTLSANENVVLLKGRTATYTIIHTTTDGVHQFSLFDPLGIQLTSSNNQIDLAKKSFEKMVKSYLNEEILLIDGKKIKRGLDAGFDVYGADDFRTNIQSIDREFFDSIGNKKDQIILRDSLLSRINTQNNQVGENAWVNFHGEKISLARLQNLGVTIDGQPLTLAQTREAMWYKKARFHAERLAGELTLLAGNELDITLIKTLRKQLEHHDITSIITTDSDITSAGVVKEQLKYIQKNIDTDNPALSPENINSLRNVGMKLPRYQRIANRFGQGMGGAGAIQSLITLYSIDNQLSSPDLTVDMIKELEKQRTLTYLSTFFNYGDMVVQPALAKVAFSRGSELGKARLASGVMIVFNLAGMGIDAYQAYDNLSKLEDVTDPKQRQDLIVNASFSIASFAVNGVVIVGVIVGAQTIPVVGLVIGGFLIVGGWVYSGVRAVENIKEHIDIDWDRELEEGIRGALGIEPTARTQQEILDKHFTDAVKHHKWVTDVDFFNNTLTNLGVDQHLQIIEKPGVMREFSYYLVDKDDNYFMGKPFKLKLSNGERIIKYLKPHSPTFSFEEANFLLENYDLKVNGDVVKVDKKISPPHFSMKRSDVVLPILGYGEGTNERYSFNNDYQNSLLTLFKERYGIKDSDIMSTVKLQLQASSPEEITLITKKADFYYLGGKQGVLISTPFYNYVDHISNDVEQICKYLNNPNSQGISFNTAGGNDIVIGNIDKKNIFHAYSGEKYFVGGNQSDIFYLKDNDIKRADTFGDNPAKYFDGLTGNDSLFIDNAQDGYHVFVNLEKGSIHYKENIKYYGINVAHVENIENIYCFNKGDDHIYGNEQPNILYGSKGTDTIYGHGGDDRITLVQGYANGGEGNDYYSIKRWSLAEQASDFYAFELSFNQETRKVDKKAVINNKYKNKKIDFHSNLVIDEVTNSYSKVFFDYSLSEITRIYIEGDHLYIKIKPIDEIIDEFKFSNINKEITIKLKNVYKSTEAGRVLNHNYQLYTRDGFLLNRQFDNLDSTASSVIEKAKFEVIYLQQTDQLADSEIKTVEIDESKDTFIVNNKRDYNIEKWGKLKVVGLAENLIYKGNEQNNFLNYLSSGNHIKVTQGKDSYQVNQEGNQYGDITFDFSEIKDKYTEEDEVNLLLPTINGYLLETDGQRLMSKGRFGDIKLSLYFKDLDETLSQGILIQDKNHNKFKINVNELGDIEINPMITAQITDKNDLLILPMGYLSDEHLIDAGAGDDIISDDSSISHILLGGEGNDIITTSKGHNVLYGGSGINYLSGGDGDDLLFSYEGEDTLMGGKGDDHYVIDGRFPGSTYIDDQLGKNHIHLIGFIPGSSFTVHDNNIWYAEYRSETGRVVKIDAMSDIYGKYKIYHHSERPSIQDFYDNQYDAQAKGLEKVWRPTDELKRKLGMPMPQKSTRYNDVIELSVDNPRENWFIDGGIGGDIVNDKTGHGRIIIGGDNHDQLSVSGGENVLYGGQGHDKLIGGDGADALISLSGNDQLNGGEGDDLFIIRWKKESTHVHIDASEGADKVILLGFSDDPKLVKIEEKTNPDGLITRVYNSIWGRKVTIEMSPECKVEIVKTTQLFDSEKLTSSWQHAEPMVDKLVQLLVQQRIEHEIEFNGSEHLRGKWGATSHVETFLVNNR